MLVVLVASPLPAAVVMMEVAYGRTAIDNACVADWAGLSESVASTVKEYSPPAVGVPEMVPAELRSRPGGRAPVVIVQSNGVGPPTAVRPSLYDVPTVPPGRLVVVTASVLPMVKIRLISGDATSMSPVGSTTTPAGSHR